MLVIQPISLQDEKLSAESLVIAGLILASMSVLLLLLSIDFYDAAAGWRGRQLIRAEGYYFHLAVIASASYSFGLSLTVIAVAMFLAAQNVWLGRLATCVALIAAVSATEFLRILWNRGGGASPRRHTQS